MKSAFVALAALSLSLSAAPSMAAPYVESKTTTALSDGTYKGAQTELRIGYEDQVAKGVLIYGEIGPGYEWTNGTAVSTGETVAVGEIGVKAKVAKNVGIHAKVTGEYGNTSQVFDLGGELKVRYLF